MSFGVLTLDYPTLCADVDLDTLGLWECSFRKDLPIADQLVPQLRKQVDLGHDDAGNYRWCPPLVALWSRRTTSLWESDDIAPEHTPFAQAL
jgi:hypothetical protein